MVLTFNPNQFRQDLSGLVESAIMHKTPGIRPDLEAELNANKSLFAQLLKNPPRSDADATLLRKATTEGNLLIFS